MFNAKSFVELLTWEQRHAIALALENCGIQTLTNDDIGTNCAELYAEVMKLYAAREKRRNRDCDC